MYSLFRILLLYFFRIFFKILFLNSFTLFCLIQFFSEFLFCLPIMHLHFLFIRKEIENNWIPFFVSFFSYRKEKKVKRNLSKQIWKEKMKFPEKSIWKLTNYACPQRRFRGLYGGVEGKPHTLKKSPSS